MTGSLHVVVGASGGLGEHFARLLAREGAAVVVNDLGGGHTGGGGAHRDRLPLLEHAQQSHLGGQGQLAETPGEWVRVLRTEFPHLKSQLPTLWSSSYFAASVGAVATTRRVRPSRARALASLRVRAKASRYV